MAGTLTGIQLDQMLQRNLTMALHRVAAAALTVAFEVRKDGMLARGENMTDDMIKTELRSVLNDFFSDLDPQAAINRARQRARRNP